MIIKTKRSPIINGITLQPGERNYPTINHKDPLTALQLQALKEIGAISFSEKIDAKPAADALDDPEQNLKINYIKERDSLNNVLAYEYISSEIDNPKKLEVEDVGKPVKSTGEIKRDRNTNKSGGGVSDKTED